MLLKNQRTDITYGEWVNREKHSRWIDLMEQELEFSKQSRIVSWGCISYAYVSMYVCNSQTGNKSENILSLDVKQFK